MAKVVAKVRGYFGGEVKEAGAIFPVPDVIMDDPKKRPKWVRPYAFAGKGDHDGDGKTGGSKPDETAKLAFVVTGPGPVVVPPDWLNGKAAERKALAKSITGEHVSNVADADKIIAKYVEATKPEAFDDAPEPETVKAATEAMGGVQPDWVAPATDDKSDI